MLFARLCGSLMPKIREPRVMGEVLGGIILGPTVFGAICAHAPGRRLSPGHRALHRRRGEPRAGLLHVPDRARGRPQPASRPRRDDARDLEHEPAVPADAGPARGAAALCPARAADTLSGLRTVHRRLDVNHGLSGPGPDHLRAPDGQAPAGHARPVGGGPERRLGLVPDRAGHGARRRGHGPRRAQDDRRGRSVRRDHVHGCSTDFGPRRGGLRRGRGGSRAPGSRSSSPESCCPPSSPTRSEWR